jgi:hypothetical protein
MFGVRPWRRLRQPFLRSFSFPPLSGAPPPASRCPTCSAPLAPEGGCSACAAAAPAMAGAPTTKKASLFTRVRQLGPAAIKLYAVLFAVPWLGVFAVVYTGVVPAADPLLLIDEHLPAAWSEGIRAGINTPLGWAGTSLPAPGEPLSRTLNAVIWAYVVADIVEIPRVFATLWLTPQVVAWQAAHRLGK